MTPQGNTFGDDGAYNADGGNTFDNVGQRPVATLSLDPSTIPGLQDYRPGDRVRAEVTFMWPKDAQPDAEGNMVEAEVISIKPEDMEPGAKAERGRQVNPDAPDLMSETSQ